MPKLQIILHCLPREIDEVERICNHLQRSSHFLEDRDKVILDFTLNVSDTLTDWGKSKLPKEFFIEKWKMMENYTVYIYNIYIYIYIYTFQKYQYGAFISQKFIGQKLLISFLGSLKTHA